jgi:glyoxylase-like metal-dependent hydrolase (beta-lactamase superfamily II)
MKQSDKHQDIRQLAPGIYQLWIPLSGAPMTDLDHMHAYLIQGVDGWWLLDTGWKAPDAYQALERAFQALEINFTDINTVLFSHCHPDHYGLAGKIKQLSPRTQMVLHQEETITIESRYINFVESEKETEVLLETHGVPGDALKSLASASLPALDFVTVMLPDQELLGGEVIQTGYYNLEVIWTPGHSPGHVCFYEPANQFLFSGDHILPTITPNISASILSGENPLGDYIHTLNRLLNLPVKEVHPGHEYSFNNLSQRIKEVLAHHQEREDQIYNIITFHPCSAYEIASKLTWHVRGQTWEQFNPWFKRMATTEVVAHLGYMQSKGKIKKEISNNLILYSIA